MNAPGKIGAFPRGSRQRVRTLDHLEVQRQVVEPREVQAQPGQWKENTREVSRQLDCQPGKFLKLKMVRPKYVRVDRPEAPLVGPTRFRNRREALSEIAVQIPPSSHPEMGDDGVTSGTVPVGRSARLLKPGSPEPVATLSQGEKHSATPAMEEQPLQPPGIA